MPAYRTFLKMLIPFTGALILALPLATPALAAGCCDDWDEPFICRIDLVGGDHVVKPRSGGDDWLVRLDPGEAIRVDLRAYDQYGRAFPGAEIRHQFVGDDCQGLIEAEIPDREHFVVRAGSRSGSCTLEFWVPGNRNLDRDIRVEVGGDTVVVPIDTRTGILAERLYRAVLDRSPSAEERRDLAGMIGRNQTRTWVENAFRSPEFVQNRSRLGTDRLLTDIYEGLLRREPDASGRRTYSSLMARGRYSEVVISILGSEEFRRDMEEELERR